MQPVVKKLALFGIGLMISSGGCWAGDFDTSISEFSFVESSTSALLEGAIEPWGDTVEITVVAPSGKPVAAAPVISEGRELLTDTQGYVRVTPSDKNSPIVVKVPGYKRVQLKPHRGPVRVDLQDFVVNGVYIATLSSKKTLARIEDLIDRTELNALVVDVKSDWGPVLKENLGPEVARLKAKGIYMIARIVTFKDNFYPRKNTAIALKRTDGGLWLDESQSAFLDPRNEGAWDYVIGIAQQAAAAGYDEIQFDYVRFPTGRNRDQIAGFSKMTGADRAAAIGGFLQKARKNLTPYGVFVAADLFGISAHEQNDPSHIGQTPEVVSKYLDYVCPMVYPSGYANDTSGIHNPVASPGAIVGDSVRRFRMRVSEGHEIRPWLQAFADYSRRGGTYGDAEIRAQIKASESAGGRGFMLWNAASNYTGAGLEPKRPNRRLP